MQTITLEEVKGAARTAYCAKTLTAQHPDPTYRRCTYRLNEHRCAIGAALNEETLDQIGALVNEMDIHRLVRLRYVAIAERDSGRDWESDLVRVAAIQGAYDHWCNAARNEDEDVAPDAEKGFLELIYSNN